MKCVIEQIEKVIYEHTKAHQDIDLITLNEVHYVALVKHANAVKLEPIDGPIRNIFQFHSCHASYPIKILHCPFQHEEVIAYIKTKLK